MENDTTKPAQTSAVLFDMDGVLVDVTDSYRKVIQETVRFFSGKEAESQEIQEFKQRGGYNNDWDLTQAILTKQGKTVPKTEIISKFQELYLGSQGRAGYIENEKWLLPKSQLEKLRESFRLGIVTGRPRCETTYVLRKFGVETFFDAVVAMEDYPPEKAKPDPTPIKLALEKLGKQEAVYVGDSVDDISAAKRAGVRAFGCIPPNVSNGRLKQLLLGQGAEKVLNSIQDITRVLLTKTATENGLRD
ncbi:MAG: TIGR01548 family HAD-type hydrolase [Candidatus Bathyarchaeota archaeon]|nr:TIGR01548 family HAD-type hydrolase [Candidatus Bathyarchaeota archaeon]